MSFSKLPMSIKTASKESDLLDKMEDVLLDKMKSGDIKCDCDSSEHGCFDCLRSAAEEYLSESEDLGLDLMEFDDIGSFSDDFEHNLDKAIASVLRKFHS